MPMRLEFFHTNPLVTGMLDFVFPPLCLGCGEYYDGADQVCERCRQAIETFSAVTCLRCGALLPLLRECPECGENFLPLFAYGNYRPPLKDIVLQFKFHGITSPARLIAPEVCDQFGEAIYSIASRADALVPIPLHPRRENMRGYNQAELFARRLAPVLLLPVRDELLERVRYRRPQSLIDHRRREQNVRGVFAVDADQTEPCRCLLVDDVVTTGATVREAARTLRRAGHEVLGVIAMAHGV